MEQSSFFEYAPPGRSAVRLHCLEDDRPGATLLLVHGFAGSAAVWDDLIAELPPGFRTLRIDLKGCGRSSMDDPEHLSAFDHAELLQARLRRLPPDEELTVIAHSVGAAAMLIALDDPDLRRRVRKLVLITPSGMERTLPPHLEELSGRSERNPLLREVAPDLRAYLLLSLFFAVPARISDRAVRRTADALTVPGAIDNLIGAARQLFIPDQLDFFGRLRRVSCPTLLLWGDADPVSSPENALLFQREIPDCTLVRLSDCGHLPHLEFPRPVAERIGTFLAGGSVAAPAVRPAAPPDRTPRRIALRRLFDRWTLGTVGFFLFLKFLQLLRRCGVRAEENGWRKATGIFMRNEYSKFILASFRLRYFRGARAPSDYREARDELISRLVIFLREQNAFHWSAEPGFFHLGRRKTFFCDIVEAHYAVDGRLEKLEPYFDDRRGSFDHLSAADIAAALDEVVRTYNRLARATGQRRVNAMAHRLRRWANTVPGYRYAARAALRLLIDRLMTATYLHCERLPEAPEAARRAQLRTPPLKKYRHPGWGLLNIFCRFSADLREADLWMQFHHVPVDGAPMQELLVKLKEAWGCWGPVFYPDPGTAAARPEIFHCGDRLFRARFYVGFRRVLETRNHLNAHYRERMGGPATIAGMILWGLSRHPFFHDRKMLLPVDASVLDEPARERELSLLFIRPGRYDVPGDPLGGFLAFQRQLNRQLDDIRARRSAGDEFLDLCSMAHPIFYHLAGLLLPEALREIVGTVGISIIRDAEMFISPLSDFQTGGFMAIGNLAVPTDSGAAAGAVSICATREQIRYYLEAMTRLAESYPQLLGLEQS